ncbi:MAG: hypothetical protein V4549_14875 [Bacteroidota bacterium]
MAATIMGFGTADNWLQGSSGGPVTRTSPWATHYIIEFNLFYFIGSNSLYFDDIVITEM